jgi:hypothetical protein
MRGLANFGGKLSVIRFEDGAGTTTNLQLRVTAGGATADTAIIPLASGGALTTLFSSDWGAETNIPANGATRNATNDGSVWTQSSYCDNRSDVLNVVAGSSVGFSFNSCSDEYSAVTVQPFHGSEFVTLSDLHHALESSG